jgi:hypothetical protein
MIYGNLRKTSLAAALLAIGFALPALGQTGGAPATSGASGTPPSGTMSKGQSGTAPQPPSASTASGNAASAARRRATRRPARTSSGNATSGTGQCDVRQHVWECDVRHDVVRSELDRVEKLHTVVQHGRDGLDGERLG